MTTNERPLRGALIGCGFFAGNHLAAWADIDGAEIVALCDTDVAKARAAGERFGIEAVHDDIESLLAERSLDFVDIATTAPSHRALVERAVSEVGTVICQKPFAENHADAAAMVAAAERAGATLLVHENFRWQKPFVELAALIEDGAVGTPHFARFSFRHGYDNYVNQPYLAEIERFTIMDVGLHLFDLARRFLGEVDTLSCLTQRLNPRVRGEDAFTALLGHADGATSVCDCSFFSTIRPEPFPRTLAWIEGPDGSLALETDGSLIRHDAEGRHARDSDPPVPDWGEAPWHVVQDSVRRFQEHVVAVMRGQATAAPSGADNLRTLTLALAAYDAAADGRTVQVAHWREAFGIDERKSGGDGE